ncbi:hypothetical protein ABZS68_39215 [Streptomyces sp. NPDC005571]|uniref:hypothetical protein n=1 Tax=Streptomyces sp. NPDC005571 TaxID=3156888 RepID=UPI0033BE1357
MNAESVDSVLEQELREALRRLCDVVVPSSGTGVRSASATPSASSSRSLTRARTWRTAAIFADREDRLVQQIERLRRHNNRQRRNVSMAPEQASPNAAMRLAREVDHT